MNKEIKKIIILCGVIIIVAAAFIMLVNNRKKADSSISTEGNANTGPVDYDTSNIPDYVIDSSEIERMMEYSSVDEDIKKIDDMKDKLGFTPLIAEKTDNDLILTSIAYIRENGSYIDGDLEDADKKEVSGLQLFYCYENMARGSVVWLFYRKMDEDESHRRAFDFKPENVTTETYNGIDINTTTKKVMFLKEEVYNKQMEGGQFNISDNFDYMLSDENDGEVATITVCEWYNDGVDYELMGKYINDEILMKSFAKSIIDQFEE